MHTHGVVRAVMMIAVAGALLSLSACALTASSAGLTPTGSIDNSLSPTPGGDSIPGDLDGNGQLSEREKEILESKMPREVTLADGSVVQVDPSQPLPAPVAQLIKDRFTGLTGQFNGDGLHDQEILGQMYTLVDQTQSETGRGVVIVFEFMGFWCTAASDAKSPIQGEVDQASVVSQAQSWASDRAFDVLVVE